MADKGKDKDEKTKSLEAREQALSRLKILWIEWSSHIQTFELVRKLKCRHATSTILTKKQFDSWNFILSKLQDSFDYLLETFSTLWKQIMPKAYQNT